MTYNLEYKSSVKKELRKLNKDDRSSVINKIKLLASNPRPSYSTKLKGSRDLFRIRHGDYRIIYQIQKDVLIIIIVKVGHRREIYKNL
ncbi:type II toxin-antitoxin system RelE/ParE family toxin [Candidatus Saccharibacteria bacterium]|nr:type II toxin-antitoxin system RelE/ParE family toxin [Candidatus Saccharibacteria bacterium]